jgi:transcriptional regulator with GAF, ATPase, and Fis domain
MAGCLRPQTIQQKIALKQNFVAQPQYFVIDECMETNKNITELESLGSLLLGMTQERSIDGLLQKATTWLAARPHTIRASIWLTLPGDLCHQCSMRRMCPDQSFCLHLVTPISAAADGDPQSDREQAGRVPLGYGDIGGVAATGKPAENIRQQDGSNCTCILPLHYKWVVLGVLVVYTRTPISQKEIPALRLIANNAGIAIANARAFAEIQHLKKQLELENAYLREELNEAREYGDIIGNSPALQNVVKQIDLVAPTNANVLILGDSGTGKELVAREIHNRSLRRNRPMIKVNCASIPKELYESEFFGHAKGSFTGAITDRSGRFEAAGGGTLFLDEVGEIPLELQSKLLRVLQEGQYERVGEEKTRQVDVRIIASTNRNLLDEVKTKRFRQDLYYRLNVFPITIEPLRNRKEDIPPLASHFLRSIAARMDRPMPRLTQANLLTLQAYDWPGNVRELQNIIERAIITSNQEVLRFDLPMADSRPPQKKQNIAPSRVLTEEEIRRHEASNIVMALNRCGWKIYGPDGAAGFLGLKPTTLAARMKKMGIVKPKGQ